jgi:hypothetical protein
MGVKDRESLMGESDRSRTIVDARSTIDASFHGVRYQVADVLRAAAFYTQRLGFTLERQQPARLRERVARPVARAAERSRRIRRPMPDGRRQEPGGWNRIVLGVTETFRRASTS